MSDVPADSADQVAIETILRQHTNRARAILADLRAGGFAVVPVAELRSTRTAIPGPDDLAKRNRNRLNEEAGKLGLPYDDLDGLLRHIYGNRDLAAAARDMTIELLTKQRDDALAAVPGPDQVVVDREALVHLVYGNCPGTTRGSCRHHQAVLAALSPDPSTD